MDVGIAGIGVGVEDPDDGIVGVPFTKPFAMWFDVDVDANDGDNDRLTSSPWIEDDAIQNYTLQFLPLERKNPWESRTSNTIRSKLSKPSKHTSQSQPDSNCISSFSPTQVVSCDTSSSSQINRMQDENGRTVYRMEMLMLRDRARDQSGSWQPDPLRQE
jgi:hypothetical protein